MQRNQSKKTEMKAPQLRNRRSQRNTQRHQEQENRQGFNQLPDNEEYFIHNSQVGPQTVVLEYKNYEFPWDKYKKQTLAQCICSFLNTQGGSILIGIHETQNFKRFVHGRQYSQSGKEQLNKDVTSIVRSISPLAVLKGLYEVSFIPVFKKANNYWRRTNKEVVRIKVFKGWLPSHQNIYSILNSKGQQQFFFRTENQVVSTKNQHHIQELRTWRQKVQQAKKQAQKEEQETIRRNAEAKYQQITEPLNERFMMRSEQDQENSKSKIYENKSEGESRGFFSLFNGLVLLYRYAGTLVQRLMRRIF